MQKLAGFNNELQKLHVGDLMKSGTEQDALRKRNALVRSIFAEMDQIDAALADALAASDEMHKALPSYRRWVLYGLKDPAWIDEPPPRDRDPLEPIMSYSKFMLAEKSITFDDRGRPSGDAALAPFEPQRQQKVEPRDLDARATSAALNHCRFQKE